MENKIWKPIPDGTYVRDSIIDGRITLKVQEEGSSITIIGPEEMWESISLHPFPHRLCCFVKPVGLDIPDGPGWWSFKGKHTIVASHETEFVRQIVEWQVGATPYLHEPDTLIYRFADEHYPHSTRIPWFREEYNGKWYRMTMPWDAQ